MRTLYDKFLKYELLRAILLIAIGVLVLLAPAAIMNIIVFILAAGVIILGVFHVVGALRNKEDGDLVTYDMVVGILLLVLGIVMMFFTKQILSILPILLGVLLVVGGLSNLIRSIQYSKAIGGLNILLIIAQVLIIAGGVLVIVNPFASAVILFQVFGIVAIVMGAADLVSYFVYRKANK